MIEITNLFEVPPALLSLSSALEIKTVFTNPTLLHLEGKRQDRLFISVLLHGNEDAGLFAVQKLLHKYQNHALPRSITIFFGNIDAAAHGVRRLPTQKDFNRVWPQDTLDTCPESELMRRVVDTMSEYDLFASIDIHNNTGTNPHYGCINSQDFRTLQLARHFSNIIIYFQNPRGVQTMAFSKFCPSVAIECGKPQTEIGAIHAFEFIDTVLHLDKLSNSPLSPTDANIYETVARVCIADNISFSFGDEATDLYLHHSLDKYNFSDLCAGTSFGRAKNNKINLLAFDDDGQEVGEDYFKNINGEIILTKSMTPAMLTLDTTIISQDCLGYLMRKLDIL